jgi:hypothetical protein
MAAHNALASRVTVNQLTPFLHKDNEEVSAQVKRLYAMLHAATMKDPSHYQGGGRQGPDPDHRQSPCEDMTRSISPPLDELGQGQGEEDPRYVIHTRDARDSIENCHQE